MGGADDDATNVQINEVPAGVQVAPALFDHEKA
jgi:hypothetical protein